VRRGRGREDRAALKFRGHITEASEWRKGNVHGSVEKKETKRRDNSVKCPRKRGREEKKGRERGQRRTKEGEKGAKCHLCGEPQKGDIWLPINTWLLRNRAAKDHKLH